MRRRSRHWRKERGLALISVLWGISILAIIATLALSASLSNGRIEANSWAAIRGRELAEASIMRAILGLTDERPDQRWRIDGVPQAFTFDGIPVTVSVQDELGKIDLNTARDDILRGLFHAAVADSDLADALTDRVLDWRRPGQQRRLNGATEEDYRNAGSPFRPRGSAFQTIDELKLVLGMTPEIFDGVAPAVTVYSQRPTIDPATAPHLALRATGQGEQAVAAALAARNAGGSGRIRPSTLDPAIGLGGRTFTVTAEVLLKKRRYVHRAVIRLTGDPARPYWILAWDSAPSPARAE
jgi:general secretion pathway protein K